MLRFVGLERLQTLAVERLAQLCTLESLLQQRFDRYLPCCLGGAQQVGALWVFALLQAQATLIPLALASSTVMAPPEHAPQSLACPVRTELP